MCFDTSCIFFLLFKPYFATVIQREKSKHVGVVVSASARHHTGRGSIPPTSLSDFGSASTQDGEFGTLQNTLICNCAHHTQVEFLSHSVSETRVAEYVAISQSLCDGNWPQIFM